MEKTPAPGLPACDEAHESVAIGRLIRRFDSIELLAEPTFRDRLTIRGVEHMPLAVN